MSTSNLHAQPWQPCRASQGARRQAQCFLRPMSGQAIVGHSRWQQLPACYAAHAQRHWMPDMPLEQLSRSQHQPELPALPSLCHAGGSGGSGNGTGRKKRVENGGSGDGDDSRANSSLSTVQLLLTAVLPATLLQLLHAPAAAAASKSKTVTKRDDHKLDSEEIGAFVESMCELSGPILNNMGFSGLLGAAAAAALKMVGRTLAATLGLCLILIQVLSHNNVITVNWSVVHEQARQVLDSTGDGRLDADDYKRWMKKGLVILSEGVPSVSGFLVGFLIGLKMF